MNSADDLNVNPFLESSKRFLEGASQALDSIMAAIETIEKYVDKEVQHEAVLYYIDRLRKHLIESIKTRFPGVKHIMVTGYIAGNSLIINLPREIAKSLSKEGEIPVLIEKYTTGLITITTMTKC